MLKKHVEENMQLSRSACNRTTIVFTVPVKHIHPHWIFDTFIDLKKNQLMDNEIWLI